MPFAAPQGRSPLLEPTLASHAPVAPLLSPRAGFLTAFFGGPWAALVIGTVNLARLRRVRQDAWLVALAAVLGIAALAVGAIAVAAPELAAAWLPSGFRTGTAVRRVTNLLGLAAWAPFYLRLRPELRAAEVAGAFASPWKVAIPALVGAGGLHFAVGLVAAMVR